jgi:hypothetical protein
MSAFPPPPPGAERRVHVRKDVEAQVELQRGDAVVIAYVNNLSLGGAFLLHSDDDVVMGELVRVHISSGTVDVVQDAKIVRISTQEPRGFAVAWIEPRARTYAVIERLMREDASPVPNLPPSKVSPPRTPGKKKNKSATVRRP